jgi:hypothetical protein
MKKVPEVMISCDGAIDPKPSLTDKVLFNLYYNI